MHYGHELTFKVPFLSKALFFFFKLEVFLACWLKKIKLFKKIVLSYN